MAKWITADGTELDTDKLELSKSMRLLDTDLGQRLMNESRAKENVNMSENGYNGYKNYETWAVCLWIGDEYNSYHHWQYRANGIKTNIANGECDQVEDGIWTAERATRFLLADEIEAEMSTHPLIDKATMYSDILNNALGRVDWHEVADSVLAE